MPTGKSQYRKGEYPTFEDYSIYAQRVVLNGEFVQHSHDFDEIVLILSGTGEHLVGQRVYSLKRGDVFVIKGETRHGFRGAENLELVNVMYDPRILLSGEGICGLWRGLPTCFWCSRPSPSRRSTPTPCS